jgi:hypothetical protein
MKMGNYSITIMNILIALGTVIMFVAIVSTYGLINKIRTSHYLKHWKILFLLMILFFMGYLTLLFFLREGDRMLFSYIVGLVFFSLEHFSFFWLFTPEG